MGVVIPSPKYFKKWLICTGNSRGTIRAYTFDEERANEFQFEGEDVVLHKNNNSFSPILSLTSTYSATNYSFKNKEEKITKNRIKDAYMEIPPHFIISGATDGWIRCFFWD